ncbi:hypothetical protein EB796_001720 [Bugula neritina]|uniref:PH domain-containing protein n=1 Tax=Bugula neritina TaxID=10212 RepID=A0A7J7KPH3_BUGNE|nr:hypothetical protein EB796_001720 [Bugula neritina]
MIVRFAPCPWSELLPGIEKFLRTTLAKESLSAFAENQRLLFVERLDILQLPPHLPPKPDGERMQIQGRKLPEPGKSKSNEDFIAHQRAISRQSLPQTGTQNSLWEIFILILLTLQWAWHRLRPIRGGLYEEPVPMENKFIDSQNYLPSSSAAIAALDNELDGDSSTSYESYDEPDVDGHYNNIGCDGQIKTDIPLPRLKPKKKKKSLSILERYYKQLLNVTQEGDVHHKTKGSWIRRYCALCDGIFYIYKDRESKPLYGLPLAGYDVILQEKEKGRSNVLRLAHPGCETHFLSTDSASEIQSWINKIEPLCSTASSDAANSQSNDRTGSISSMETYTDNALLNGSPTMKNRKVANTMSSDGKREKKGKIGKFLSETFGKKKGRSVSQQLEISEGALLDRHCLASPDISIAGLVKLSSPLWLNDDSWQYKYCAIRNGTFECFKDDSNSSDLDFSCHSPSMSWAIRPARETTPYVLPSPSRVKPHLSSNPRIK